MRTARSAITTAFTGTNAERGDARSHRAWPPFSATLGRMMLRALVLALVVSGVVLACGGNQTDAAPPSTPTTGTPDPSQSAPATGDGQMCGTRGAPPCPEGTFCDWKAGDDCGASDKPGHCDPVPAACPQIMAPVCGCDGKTYGNGCKAASAGSGVKKNGPC